jgi:hypothetical protein
VNAERRAGGSAVVTGAGSGIGRAIAQQAWTRRGLEQQRRLPIRQRPSP